MFYQKNLNIFLRAALVFHLFPDFSFQQNRLEDTTILI